MDALAKLLEPTNDKKPARVTVPLTEADMALIDEVRKYGSVNAYSGLTITSNYTGYSINSLYYMDYEDGYTHITGTTASYQNEEVYQGMVTRNEHLLGFVDEPQIFSDIFVERGKQGIMERNLRLGEMDSVGEISVYGSGYFNVKKQ